MKRMAHIIGLLFVFGLLLCGNEGLAEEKPQVYGENQTLSAGEEVELAIRIKDNPGLMGFKIHGSYEKKQLKILSVRRGELVKADTFVHNAGEKQGEFDVMWCGTKNVVGDGVLFYIKLKTGKHFSKETALTFQYSKEDTFNEAWEDVALTMNQVNISPKKVPSATTDAVGAGETKKEDKDGGRVDEQTENSEKITEQPLSGKASEEEGKKKISQKETKTQEDSEQSVGSDTKDGDNPTGASENKPESSVEKNPKNDSGNEAENRIAATGWIFPVAVVIIMILAGAAVLLYRSQKDK